MSKASRREAIEGYLFLLPNFLGFLIFFAIPLALSFYYAFTNYDLFSAPKFVALDNFGKALGFSLSPEAYRSALSEGRSSLQAVGKFIKPNDPIFYVALRNTLVYAAGVLVFSIIPAFLLAWVLNSRLKGMTFFRALFYIPVVASIVGSALVWFWIYQRDSGILNTVITAVVKLLNQLIFNPIGRPLADPLIGWLVTPQWALFSLIILTSWATIGYDMVIFLAALQGIPNYLFEAATVDGATRWQSLTRIVVPMLSPTIFFVLVTNTINVLQVFPEPYIMTQGGPANSTLTIVYYLYQKGFQRFQMGYGAALAWLVFGLIFIITQIQFRVSSRLVFEE
jgi:multiple sugar transport system permease protein